MAETIIEIAGPLNESVFFNATGEYLRGRWSQFVTGGKSTSEALALLHAACGGIIPGICLALDPQARTARRFDPLTETEEGRAKWEKISKVLEDNQQELGLGKPWPTHTYEALTPNQLKTWMCDMAALLENGYAQYVRGERFPSLAEIKSRCPGSRVVFQWLNHPMTKEQQQMQPQDGEILLDTVETTRGQTGQRESREQKE